MKDCHTVVLITSTLRDEGTEKCCGTIPHLTNRWRQVLVRPFWNYWIDIFLLTIVFIVFWIGTRWRSVTVACQALTQQYHPITKGSCLMQSMLPCPATAETLASARSMASAGHLQQYTREMWPRRENQCRSMWDCQSLQSRNEPRTTEPRSMTSGTRWKQNFRRRCGKWSREISNQWWLGRS